MTARRLSIALTNEIDAELAEHLLRADGQEDVCFATYRPSTGSSRRSGLITGVVLPLPGERSVHGNASFTGDFVVRAATTAAERGEGIALLHSHPGASHWQRMSTCDEDAEHSYAHLVHAITGHPLVGMTLAGRDKSWSARFWAEDGSHRECESVRVVGRTLDVSWNPRLRPAPPVRPTQMRSVSGWGPRIQANIARLRVLVVGAGSVGLDVALRLAASGIEHVAVMDFDTVEAVNLDRLIGATVFDATLHRSKAEVARRLVAAAATAESPIVAAHELSVCEPDGLAEALDYDVIFSCVDRPWARAVLNTIAYADLIPVIDGGIHIDPFEDDGMRNATWRSHVIRPGRPCLSCNKQLNPALVPLDRDGLLDDPEYIRGAGIEGPARQNVATLSVSVVAGLLAQFVSLVAAPGGQGEPGPLQYVLSTHSLDRRDEVTQRNCYFERATAAGDSRVEITGHHGRADDVRAARRASQGRRTVRFWRAVDATIAALQRTVARNASARSRAR